MSTSDMESIDFGNFSNPCDEFRDLSYMILSGVRAFLAFFSFVCCTLVIVLILLFKRHHYFVQRLVLYVCIIAAVNSITIITQKVDYFDPDEIQEDALDKYCIFAGFLEFYTSLVELLMLICITHGLYQSVVTQNRKKYLEGIYLGCSILIPLVIACVPFFGLTYGKSGPWCWIRERKGENCEKDYFGISIQFICWYFPLIVVTIATVTTYVASLYKVRNSMENHWQGPYDPELFVHRGRLRKVIKMMFAYLPVLYLFMNLFALPNAIHWAIADNPSLPLWVLNGVFPPLRGALFALPYLFHTDTRRQLKKVQIRAAIRQRFFKKHKITAYPAKECNFSDSLTFPGVADTSVERLKIYRNSSLRQSHDPTLQVELGPLNPISRLKIPEPPVIPGNSVKSDDTESLGGMSSMKTSSTLATVSSYMDSSQTEDISIET